MIAAMAVRFTAVLARFVRTTRGSLSQAEFGRAVGIDQSSISKLERGAKTIRGTDIEAILEHQKMTVEVFFHLLQLLSRQLELEEKTGSAPPAKIEDHHSPSIDIGKIIKTSARGGVRPEGVKFVEEAERLLQRAEGKRASPKKSRHRRKQEEQPSQPAEPPASRHPRDS